ncbi:hypothetical protein COU61_04045 [Candidatus Pacearchaeota archaeon CG10_big_fil_rev_8_21_14_0_10_35_13]|nr:MAG: hypothetical protein COU61_04045 [Candidatus Pacearchaeota archaeon CG10_big_fil_rev_8_21_14_0_10_35_13]
MDTLTENNAQLFHRLMDSLLFFANKKLNIIKNCNSTSELHDNHVEDTIPIREKVFSGDSLINEYVKNNPDNFPPSELEIVSSWKKSLEGKFFITKYEKDYALLLHSEQQRVYGVKGIGDSFKEKFDGRTDIMIKIRLLHFRDDIIYEGIFFPYSVSFGRGMRSSIKTEMDSAIQKDGIITSLEKPLEEKKVSDEELLRFYLKSQDIRDRYHKEIHELKRKSPLLEATYHQECARIRSKGIKKNLKAIGIKGHFAVLVDSIVTSALTENELNQNIKKLVPKDKQLWVYRLKIV